MNRSGLAFGALVAGGFAAGFVACATAGGGMPTPFAPACHRGLCAAIVERSLSNTIAVDVWAPERASLHNAWVAEPGVAPCRGGRALNAVGVDAGVRIHGPLPLATGGVRLKLAFTLAFTDGTSLDLDVRSPAGVVCLRLPFEAVAADGVAPSPSDGGRG